MSSVDDQAAGSETSPAQAYLDEVGPDRALRISGVYNVRDLGGLTGTRGAVRRGRVLRSAALHQLTAAGAHTLADLGLRTVFDLRTRQERDEGPSRISGAPELGAVNIVVVDYLGTLDNLPPDQIGVYEHLVERSGLGIVDVFEYLGRPDAAPALVHCTAGKDRTGLTVALLLEVLGVPRPTILADYLASNNGLLGRMRSHVSAELLNHAFTLLDTRYGSPVGYLEAHGLTSATIRALRRELLEQPA